MPITGIDVSDFQSDVDWHAVKASGRSFAFTKATEGTNFTAHTFATNWAGIKAAGLIRGAYHFGRPGSDPIAQAQFFWRIVSSAGYGLGDLPLALDLEVSDGRSAGEINAWTAAFVAEITKLAGRKPIIYTGAFFYTGPSLGCALWLPSYYDGVSVAELGSITPKLPPAWFAWTFWQHTSKATVPGVNGPCDHSVFAGTGVELLKMIGGTPKPSRLSLTARLVKAGFGPRSVPQVIKALGDWNGEVLPPRPEDSQLFRRLTKAGFGPDSARRIVLALR